MEQNGVSFLAVRRLSGHRPSPADIMSGSTAWIGLGFSRVFVQRRDNDARISFDMSPLQEECLQRLQNRIEVPYDNQNREHQVLAMSDIEKHIGYPKPHRGYSKPREHMLWRKITCCICSLSSFWDATKTLFS